MLQKSAQALDQPMNLYKYEDDPSMKDDLPPVRYWRLFRFAKKLDYLFLAMGLLCAAGNGISLVFYANPFGDLTQAFAPNVSDDFIVEQTKKAVFSFLTNAAIVFVNSWIMQAAWSISSERQTIQCRKQYFRSLFRHQPAWYDHKRSTEIAEKMYIQTNHLQQAIGSKIASFIMIISLVTSGLVISMTRGWRMAIVLISFIPVMFFTGVCSNRITKKADKATNQVITRMNGSALQVIDSIRTVKVLNAQAYEVDRYHIYLARLEKQGLYYGCLKAVVWAVFFFCIIMNYTLGFWYGSILVSRQAYNDNTGASFAVADVVVIFFTIYTSNLSLSQIPDCLSIFQLGCLSGAKIFSVIDRKSLIESGTTPIPIVQNICFKDVYFRFDSPLFQNFSIKINRGKTAFVGESGSGKSTLVNLLLRFYDPISGSIVVNNSLDYTTVNLEDLRQSIGYVGQEPVLMGKTIREALLADGKTDAQIIRSLKNAQAYEFVTQIGIDKEFGQLSGGQKQRIAIARALLKNPQVLILDEATSALDRRNQREIQHTIDNLKVPITIIIAHKIDTIEKADHIYVLNRGKIIEEGNYTTLFAQKGKFHELAVAQMAIDRQDQTVKVVADIAQILVKDADTEEKLAFQQITEQAKQAIINQFQWSYISRLFGFNGAKNIMLVVGVLCSMVIGCVFPLFSSFLAKIIVILSGIKYATTEQEKADFGAQAMQLSLYLLIICLSALVAVSIRGTIFNILRERLGLTLKKMLFTKLLKMNVTYFDRKGTGWCSGVLNNDCTRINTLASQFLADVFENLATVVCGLTIAFVACWQMTLIGLAVFPILLIAGKLQLALNDGFASDTDKAYKKAHQIVIDSLLNYKTVLSFNQQNNLIEAYEELMKQPLKIAVKKGNAAGISFGLAQALISCIFALIFYIGALLIRDQHISVLKIYTSIYAIMFTAMQAGGNLGLVPNIAEMKLFCTNVFQILDNQEEVETSPNGGLKTPIDGNIECRNLVFQYPMRQGKVYNDLSLVIPAGKKVALVGPSGCGKSTLLQLILKMYQVQAGSILVEGVNIDAYDLGHLRDSISVVSQEPVLFNRSVYQNIKYNQIDATEEDVLEAARMANALDFIRQGDFGVKNYINEEQVGQEEAVFIQGVKMPSLRRKVGPKGGFLSGGQKQRIAIARALMRKPKLMILDEATSALDSTNQKQVQAALDKIHGCTQIVIAHRLVTIKDADIIYAFHKGEIVESGTFDQLVANRGYFYNIAQGKAIKE